MVTVPFSQVLVLPLITAKLARNVPTIPFSYASPYFFCINAPLGTQHKPPTFTPLSFGVLANRSGYSALQTRSVCSAMQFRSGFAYEE